MGTKVLQMAKMNVRPEEVASLLGELLLGRNIAPPEKHDAYMFVSEVKQEGRSIVVETDEGTSFRITVEKCGG